MGDPGVGNREGFSGRGSEVFCLLGMEGGGEVLSYSFGGGGPEEERQVL